MIKSTTNQNAGQFTGWHMLFLMLAFFGVIFSVNFFMAWSASRTWTGLVVKNSYIASQQFNTKLANARAQAKLGWQGGLDYDGRGLVFFLHDGADTPLDAQKVSIALNRPIGVSGDQVHTLYQSPDGSWFAPVTLEPGAWNAQIVVQFANQPDYEHHARLNVGGTN